MPIDLRQWLIMMRNMTDDLLMMIDHEWWFIMIDNGRSWMMTDWQTDWLNELLIDG